MSKRKKQVGGRKEAPPAMAGGTELQSLLQANRDLIVRRDQLGEVSIVHAIRDGDLRRVEVIVLPEKEGYPTVRIIGQQIPASYQKEVHALAAKVRKKDHTTEDESKFDELKNRRYDALRTYVETRIAEDERVHTKVTYQKREAPEGLTMKADPYELVTTARRGLELLQAYLNDPSPKTWQIREQITDDYRPDVEHKIAEASPLVDAFLRREGISYDSYGTAAMYALNVLNKVTGAMLPQEMPPVPKNRKEPTRRTRPPVRRRPLGL